MTDSAAAQGHHEHAGHLVVHSEVCEQVSRTALRGALSAIGQGDLVTLPRPITPVVALNQVLTVGPRRGYLVTHDNGSANTEVRSVIPANGKRHLCLATVTVDLGRGSDMPTTPQLTVTYNDQNVITSLSAPDRLQLRTELDNLPARFDAAAELLPKNTMNAVVDQLLARLHGVQITGQSNTVFVPGADIEPIATIQSLFHAVTHGMKTAYAMDVIPLPRPLTPTMTTLVANALTDRFRKNITAFDRSLRAAFTAADADPDRPLELLAEVEFDVQTCTTLADKLDPVEQLIAAYRGVLPPAAVKPLAAELERCRAVLA